MPQNTQQVGLSLPLDMPKIPVAIGVACALGAALLASFNSSLAKVMLTLRFSAMELLLMRSTGTLVILGVIVLIFYRPSLKVKRKDLPVLIFYGICGMVFTPLTYYWSIERISIGIALLLQYTAPIFVVLWMRFVRNVPITPSILGGMATCLVGLALVGASNGSVRLDFLGVLAGLASGMGFAAVFLLAGRALTTRPPIVTAAFGYLAGTVIWHILLPVWNIPLNELLEPVTLPAALGGIDVAALWVVGSIVVLGSVLPGILMLTGVAALGPARASTLGMSEPVMSAAVAWLILGEILTPLQLVGGAITVGGLAFLELKKRQVAPRLNTSGSEKWK
ncbi:EamA family transporter [Pelagibacterium lacus]|uniref:EamA domain-containing protein n=1 Tax=Pelagibacterium lacus TaxID=2282655 RepID=A0A369W1F7_9HYPH|nr:EamA family transporter [Pelagibacterium lacus]RDE07787.1 hypothetical protein DVH29_14900 [Pelagibacterium lacus]